MPEHDEQTEFEDSVDESLQILGSALEKLDKHPRHKLHGSIEDIIVSLAVLLRAVKKSYADSRQEENTDKEVDPGRDGKLH